MCVLARHSEEQVKGYMRIMTTFCFFFCLGGSVFPEFQQFLSKWKKKPKQNSLWFSQFHPSFLKTGARYIPAQGIISDQSVCFPVRNIHSMRRCAPAGSPSQCPAHGKDSHLVPAGRGQPCAGASASLLPASCSRATWQPARQQQSGNPMLFPECNPNTTLCAEVGHSISELTASGIWPCILPTSIFWRWKSFCFS